MENSDFGTTIKFDQEFASGKTKEEIVLAINHFLPLHTRRKIDKFHLYFYVSKNFLQSIEKWVSWVVGKGVEEIILDFSMGSDDLLLFCNDESNLSELPCALFACSTLKKLRLRRCIFSPPIGFVKFDLLKSLSIEDVNIKSDDMKKLISSSLLENLRLANCISLDAIAVSSESLLKLTIENPRCDYYDISITTPNLKTFIYYGMHCFGDSDFNSTDSFIDISSLSDAFICAIESSEPEHDFVKLMYDLRQVEVLTVCTYTFWCVTIRDYMEQLPISMPNLKELQLLAHYTCSDLEGMYGFFSQCPSPFIEKLFVLISCSIKKKKKKEHADREVKDGFVIVCSFLDIGEKICLFDLIMK